MNFENLPFTVGLILQKISNIEAQFRMEREGPQLVTDDLMIIDEAATFLHLSKQRVYCLVSNRKIPFMKKSKRLYFSRKSLISWLEESNRRMAA